jgi:hypothetical protein
VRRHSARVLTLSLGQVYYALVQEREARGIKDIAISRVEQISPFPYDLVRAFGCLRAVLPLTVFARVAHAAPR